MSISLGHAQQLLAALLIGVITTSPVEADDRGLAPYPAPTFARGIVLSSWDGSYSNEAAWRAHLRRFHALGINWIEIMTFAHQPRVEGPEIHPAPRSRWPSQFIQAARAEGFKILLKPHVWSREFYDGSGRWRGSIRMKSEAKWREWFAQYEAFIMREAALAAETGVDMFCVGLEYVEATKRTESWRRVIAQVRRVFTGPLTYAADGNHELGHLQFWDALDVIGVDAYFNLGPKDDLFGLGPMFGWIKPLTQIEELATRYKRPVIFTEAGFPSIVDATLRPWQWPKGTETVDLQGQADAYYSLLSALTPKPWFRGVFWWKWYEKPERGVSHLHDYSPRGKPAETVLRAWYQTRNR